MSSQIDKYKQILSESKPNDVSAEQLKKYHDGLQRRILKRLQDRLKLDLTKVKREETINEIIHVKFLLNSPIEGEEELKAYELYLKNR
jgi:hypothetical protein